MKSSGGFVSPWRQGGRAVWSCVRKHVLGGVCAIAVQAVAVVVVLLLIVVLVVVMVMVVVLVLDETQSSKFPCYIRALHFTARLAHDVRFHVQHSVSCCPVAS